LKIHTTENGNVTNGIFVIDQGQDGFPVYCDFTSDSDKITTYLHPNHLREINDVSALFDVTSEVVIRHVRSDDRQYTAKINQLARFSDVPLHVQINGFIGYWVPSYPSMDPYLYLGMVPKDKLNLQTVQGWMIEDQALNFTNSDSNYRSYFVFLANTNDITYNSSPCLSYATLPLMKDWKDLVK